MRDRLRTASIEMDGGARGLVELDAEGGRDFLKGVQRDRAEARDLGKRQSSTKQLGTDADEVGRRRMQLPVYAQQRGAVLGGLFVTLEEEFVHRRINAVGG